MKIVYLINSLKHPGGMERVLVEKANYFSEKFKYEIFIITTDQNNEENFYKLNEKIKHIDLGINYYEEVKLNILKRIIPYFKKQKIHKKLLEEYISKIEPNFIVSLGCEDTYILPKIKYRAFKIREFHFGKNYRKEHAKSFNKGIIYKLKACIDTFRDELLIKKYDKLILLTKEDLKKWKDKSKIKVIYNSIKSTSSNFSNCNNKKIISVGRLDGQKGYDRLIEAWKIIKLQDDEWVLEIYGDGVDKEKLMKKIIEYKLENSFFLRGVTNKINEKYQESSIYVMTSRYEGFGMVLVEAMANGLPVVAFDCCSGPKDIISNDDDGYLIKNGDIKGLADKIYFLMKNDEKRKKMGIKAKKSVDKFLQKKIMKEWKDLFENF